MSSRPQKSHFTYTLPAEHAFVITKKIAPHDVMDRSALRQRSSSAKGKMSLSFNTSRFVLYLPNRVLLGGSYWLKFVLLQFVVRDSNHADPRVDKIITILGALMSALWSFEPDDKNLYLSPEKQVNHTAIMKSAFYRTLKSRCKLGQIKVQH